MGFTTDTKSGRTFVNIIGGRFAKRVDANTEGATAREFVSDKKTGAKKTVHELYYRDYTGVIKSVEIETGDFGDQIKIDFTDVGESVTVSIPLASREGKSFLMRLPNINLNEEVTLAPYNFVSTDGKKVIGMNVYQGFEGGKPKKIDWYFTKENPKGMPFNSGTEQVDTDEFKLLMKQQDIFLKKFTKKFVEENFDKKEKMPPNQAAAEKPKSYKQEVKMNAKGIPDTNPIEESGDLPF